MLVALPALPEGLYVQGLRTFTSDCEGSAPRRADARPQPSHHRTRLLGRHCRSQHVRDEHGRSRRGSPWPGPYPRSVPLGLLFLFIVWAKKQSAFRTVAFYWLAIIMLRTMATNIADFVAHDLHLSYPAFMAGLIASMGVMVWADRFRSAPISPHTATRTRFPATDWRYWLLMLAAGGLGTAAGDWLADDVGLGVYGASALRHAGLPRGCLGRLSVWREQAMVLDRHCCVPDVGHGSRRHAGLSIPLGRVPASCPLVELGDYRCPAHRHYLGLDQPRRSPHRHGDTGGKPLTRADRHQTSRVRPAPGFSSVL